METATLLQLYNIHRVKFIFLIWEKNTGILESVGVDVMVLCISGILKALHMFKLHLVGGEMYQVSPIPQHQHQHRLKYLCKSYNFYKYCFILFHS